jgi:Uma2 family endonuclease
MTLAPPDPAAPQALATGLEPLLLPPGLKLSPEQFALVCEANPEAVLELTAAGRVIAMTPTGGETSRRNARLLFRLQAWA